MTRSPRRTIYLTIVAETAFTNTLFVAMPGRGRGQRRLPAPDRVPLGPESDESRHISNGYAIASHGAVRTSSNHQLLERDLRYAWWNNHAVVDAAIGTFIEYGTKDRRKDRESYAEMWRRWIYDDYYRSYLDSAGEVRPGHPARPHRGSVEPDLEQGLRARGRPVLRHRAGSPTTGASTRWTDKDFEWFEYKYPGWYDKYGAWWENGTTDLSMPNGHHAIAFDAKTSTTCTRTAAGPAWSRALIREDMVTDQVDGQCPDLLLGDRATGPTPTAFRPDVPRAARPRTWASSPASASGRRCTTAGTVADADLRHQGYVRDDGQDARSRSRTSTSTPRRCGRWTTCKPHARTSCRPNVLLNEMTDEQRAAFHVADYNAQGPGRAPRSLFGSLVPAGRKARQRGPGSSPGANTATERKRASCDTGPRPPESGERPCQGSLTRDRQ